MMPYAMRNKHEVQTVRIKKIQTNPRGGGDLSMMVHKPSNKDAGVHDLISVPEKEQSFLSKSFK